MRGTLLALVTAFGFPQQLALKGLCTAQRERVPCEERSSDFKRARATHVPTTTHEPLSARRIALVGDLGWLSACGAYPYLASGAYPHHHGSLNGSCGGGCGGIDVERHGLCDPNAQPFKGNVTFAPVPGRCRVESLRSRCRWTHAAELGSRGLGRRTLIDRGERAVGLRLEL
jgi:hypothetical protein